MGLSIKDVRSHGGLSSADVLRTNGGGYSNADIRTFWCKKHRIFRNLWFVHMDKGGGVLSQCGHFADKGEGSIFRDIVQTSFMDGP